MPAKKPALLPRKPFQVMEVGCGDVPLGLVRKAQRSLEKGKSHRQFVGVDKKLDLDKLFKRAGIKELPSNLRLVESCAAKALSGLEPESQNVIFGSYLLNMLADKESCIHPGYSCDAVLLGMAVRALKPDGRMVFVQDKPGALDRAMEAMHNGMKAHS